jgi:hypothetical protein
VSPSTCARFFNSSSVSSSPSHSTSGDRS